MLNEKKIALLKAVQDGTLLHKVDEEVKDENGESATADLRELAKAQYIQTEFVDCGWINQMITGITDKGRQALEEQTKQ